VTLAKKMLGTYMIRPTKKGVIACMIVETEAYKAPED